MSRALPMFFSDYPDAESGLRTRVIALRQEITLAESKRTALDKAIESRKNALARLEAQLALVASPARSAL